MGRPRERIRRLKRTAATALAVGSAAAVVFVAQNGAAAPTAVTQSAARQVKAGTARGFYVEEGVVSLAATDESPVMRV